MTRRIRTEFDADYNAADYGVSGFEPTLTKQSEAKNCDINVIVKKWQSTGVLPTNLNDGLAQYADVSDMPDYRGCLDVVIQAQQAFSQLPSDLRHRFSNDPAIYLDFCSNPANAAEMVSLGLATRRVEPSTGSEDAPPKAGVAEPVGGSTEAPPAAS